MSQTQPDHPDVEGEPVPPTTPQPEQPEPEPATQNPQQVRIEP